MTIESNKKVSQKNKNELKNVTTSKSVLVEGLRYAHLGLVLPVSVLIGWWTGSLLDGWVGTKWINLVGLLFGIVAGFYELIRTTIKLNKAK